MEIGIIGLGRLGKLAVKFLGRDFALKIHDIRDLKNEFKEDMCTGRVRWGSLDECARCPFVLLLVPISQIASLLQQISPNLQPGAWVIDTCSVKERPIAMMKNYLPKHVNILGTHPMFGPDSVKDTLFGAKIVICKERGEEEQFQKIIGYLKQNGMRVIETSPEDHDRDISKSLILTHFIGRALVSIGAKNQVIDTKGYRRLMRILETVVNDSWQLFEDMNHYNKFSGDIRKEFIGALKELDQKLLATPPQKQKD